MSSNWISHLPFSNAVYQFSELQQLVISSVDSSGRAVIRCGRFSRRYPRRSCWCNERGHVLLTEKKCKCQTAITGFFSLRSASHLSRLGAKAKANYWLPLDYGLGENSNGFSVTGASREMV